MATIQTAIELQDNFTSIFYQVIHSVNLGLSAMEDLHQTMNAPVDTASIEAARNSINQATAAVLQLDAAMQGMASPDTQTLSDPHRSAPVHLPIHPDVPNPLIPSPDPVLVPIEWQSDEGLEVFTNTGVERFEQEVASVNAMMEQLSETQARITQQANESEILSPQASYDVQNVENRIQELIGMINRAENNPLNLGTDEANTQLERLRMQLNQTLQLQHHLDEAMQGMDIREINAAYLRLSQNVANTERMVRDSFSNIPPVEIPIHWQSYDGLEVFTNTGIERFRQEMQSANNMLEQLSNSQSRITQLANEVEILSPQAQDDVQRVENRINALQQSIRQIEENPLTIGSDSVNAGLERLRARLSQLLELQGNLNAAMQGADISEINAAYLQLSQHISEAERMVRDSFSNIPPVEVPIHWQSYNGLEVFTNTGIDRFRQEAQSANNMLEQLSSTQAAITRQAYNSNLFPPQSFQDLNRVASGIDRIKTRIQQMENNPLTMGTDAANAELEQLRAQLNQAIQEQQNLNQAMNDLDVQAANDAYLRLQQIIGDTERHIRDNVDEQGRLNREIEQGTQKANELMRMIGGIVVAYATSQTLLNALDLSDALASTTARLNMMNDELQTMQDLQNMIYLSAERARGSYRATADAVAKLGLMAGDAFNSSEEIIAFMEQVNKKFIIAGTEAAGIDAAMLQLTQAMGSGILRGEEYNSILEQAPNIIQTIADYLEVPKGQLKDMAAEGKITADVVKAAMFAAADETNEQFERMSMTFEQIQTSFENTVLMALQPLLNNLNDIANSEAFNQLVSHAADSLSILAAAVNPILEQLANTQALWDFINSAIDALTLIGAAALGILERIANTQALWEFANSAVDALTLVSAAAFGIFDLILSGITVLADNWSWLSPIIYGVAGALAVYYGAQLAANTIGAISKGIHYAMAVAQMIHAAATGALTAATAANIAEQNGLNAALCACPIVWIIMLIIALIALFYAAVAAVNKFAGTSVSATGIICGAFMFAFAVIGNLLVALFNFAFDIFVAFWNFIATFANFFGNVFNDPVGAIARLFFDLVDYVLGLLESLASAIDTIFIGSNLAGAVARWRDSLGGLVDETFGHGEEIMAKMDASSLHLERFEYGDAVRAGYSFGKGIDEGISNFDPASLFGTTDIPNLSNDNYMLDYTGTLNTGEIGSGVDDIAGNTGAMANAMDITEEDLKYLRDIAEQEAINRFTTAEIKIDMSGMNNHINNGMDLDGVMSGLTDAVNEAVETMTEGVHV